jgi:hypothetical protein
MNSLITEEMISLTELSVRIEKEYKREGGANFQATYLKKRRLIRLKMQLTGFKSRPRYDKV